MSVKPIAAAAVEPIRPPIYTILQPFHAFARLQASSGILLLICTVVALFWANSPWGDSYDRIFSTPLTVGIGSFVISKPLLLWINDGLMAIFFFVVGLEIKREILAGELSSFRQAALPIAAAVGGMIVPAGLYLLLNAGRPGAGGWGIPMATDIAFALGVLALLGSRAPLSLKIFLTAFAIVDDIGAVLVIALFYTAQIASGPLLIGFGLFCLAALMNWSGVRRPLIYTLIGIAMWVAFLKSGVHATVAGVLLALTIPASTRIDAADFLRRGYGYMERFAQAGTDANRTDANGTGEKGTGENPLPGTSTNDIMTNAERQHILHALEVATERVQTPLQRMEHALHPWVSFCIMPVFALANAGVALSGGNSLMQPAAGGIILGLLVGKPLGVLLFSYISVRLGIAAKPADLSWQHIHGAGWLGGIGFTMALFITGLAFGGSELVPVAKLAILAASFIAGTVGFAVLLRQKAVADMPEA